MLGEQAAKRRAKHRGACCARKENDMQVLVKGQVEIADIVFYKNNSDCKRSCNNYYCIAASSGCIYDNQGYFGIRADNFEEFLEILSPLGKQKIKEIFSTRDNYHRINEKFKLTNNQKFIIEMLRG